MEDAHSVATKVEGEMSSTATPPHAAARSLRAPARSLPTKRALLAAAALAASAAAAVALVVALGASAAGPPPTPAFRADWMAHLAPVIDSLSVLDLALPGTHDSTSYDSSTSVSEGGTLHLSASVRTFVDMLGLSSGAIGEFIRRQAVTQTLDMRSQLESGVRFLDFRVMYTRGPTAATRAYRSWYSLHMVQTERNASHYLREVRAFVQAHPREVVVLFLSRHGSTCAVGEAQYPGVPLSAKRAFWAELKALFAELLFDSAAGLNATSLAQMVSSGRRVVVYASDHAEMTGSDPYAYDACAHLHNDWTAAGAVTDPSGAVAGLLGVFGGAASKRAELKAADALYLVSMAGSPPDAMIEQQALIALLPSAAGSSRAACVALFNIPGFSGECPTTLLEAQELRHYYSQAALDAVAAANLSALQFPGAIYLDGLAPSGTIETGTPPRASAKARFAYVAALLHFNVRVGCRAGRGSAAACDSLGRAMSAARRSEGPLRKWSDPSSGRLVGWP